ncbi:retrotransposon gag domain-containing protein [Artemisia annua]|uniref:Retrotransposon gag domain-containing protein n=1 Tax=Artemisia annua TaxID=35608 RepID=A0A2U1Q6G2_ARTAN|nr:retrotransposon gag domain-containing protein [Artemisia annua]
MIGKDKILKGQNELIPGLAPREPDSNHDHQLLTDRSEKAHLIKVPQEKLGGVQAQPDPKETPQPPEHETAKQRKNTGRKRRAVQFQGRLKEKVQRESDQSRGKKEVPRRKALQHHTRKTTANISAAARKQRPEVTARSFEKEKCDPLTESTMKQATKRRTKKMNDGEDNQMQPYIPKGVDPFIQSIYKAKLSKKTYMLDNVQLYDRSGDPEDHVKVFQMAARAHNWDMATQCQTFWFTLTGAARIWFENIPQESISSYRELKDAFLEAFLKMERHKGKDKKICCARQGSKESIEDFKKRFLTESRKVKGMPNTVKISKFMNKISNPGLIKHLHKSIPESVEEMVKATMSYRRGEEATRNLYKWR